MNLPPLEKLAVMRVHEGLRIADPEERTYVHRGVGTECCWLSVHAYENDANVQRSMLKTVLPRVDGWNVVVNLRSVKSVCQEVPVYVVSATRRAAP